MAFDLERFDLSLVTRRLELPEISVDPAKPVTLIGRQADPRNPAFRNELFKQKPTPPATSETAPPADAAPAEPAALARAATEDLTTRGVSADGVDVVALYAASVLTGWESVTENGEPVPFSAAAAEQFLRALLAHCNDVWVRVFLFFREDFRKPTVDPVDLGKE